MKRVTTTEEMLKEFDDIWAEMRDILSKKSNDYGVECWQVLGAKGCFVDLNRKYWRLKTLVWDGNPSMVTEEKIFETVLDLANHCFQMAFHIKHQKE